MGDVSIHSGSGRLSYLDGWRGLAIICVLAGHFLFIKSFNLGPFGVELFFVLSGRLMADILFVFREDLLVYILHYSYLYLYL
jgi:peptidoglycan/LPS O-acetylase OafA/YrhL